jgi:hypothetical protein
MGILLFTEQGQETPIMESYFFLGVANCEIIGATVPIVGWQVEYPSIVSNNVSKEHISVSVYFITIECSCNINELIC